MNFLPFYEHHLHTQKMRQFNENGKKNFSKKSENKLLKQFFTNSARGWHYGQSIP